jgi:hypothetical protein
MNPLGLRSTHVQGARSQRMRPIKTPPVPVSARPIQRLRSNSTHDCAGVSGYAEFTHIVAAFTRVQCNNVNFFSSSRKDFAPL